MPSVGGILTTCRLITAWMSSKVSARRIFAGILSFARVWSPHARKQRERSHPAATPTSLSKNRMARTVSTGNHKGRIWKPGARFVWTMFPACTSCVATGWNQSAGYWQPNPCGRHNKNAENPKDVVRYHPKAALSKGGSGWGSHNGGVNPRCEIQPSWWHSGANWWSAANGWTSSIVSTTSRGSPCRQGRFAVIVGIEAPGS